MIWIGILASVSIACTVAESEESSVTGDLRLHELRSEVFGNKRQLRVWLPPGYDSAENRRERYPVLYLNDGQTLFDPATSTFNPLEWKADETASELIGAGEVRPLILVGIDHAGRRERSNEYLPYYDEFLEPPLPNPQGFEYPRFLLDEVIPFVEARYRTVQNRLGRGLGGASYGGLIALYSAVKAEKVFGYLLLESPSLYVQDLRILKEVAEMRSLPERVFIGVGTNEEGRAGCEPGRIEGGSNREIVRDVHKLEELLKGRGLNPGRLRVEVVPCAEHSETYWGLRFRKALPFLFPPENPAREAAAETCQSGRSRGGPCVRPKAIRDFWIGGRRAATTIVTPGSAWPWAPRQRGSQHLGSQMVRKAEDDRPGAFVRPTAECRAFCGTGQTELHATLLQLRSAR